MNVTEIAGYTYRTENYTPANLIEALIAAGEASPAARDLSVEDALDQIAAANAIDRRDENTFDSNDFPKVIFWNQVDLELDWEWLGEDGPVTPAQEYADFVAESGWAYQ